MTTLLIREYLDIRPGGWLDYTKDSTTVWISKLIYPICVSIVFDCSIFYETSVVTSFLLRSFRACDVVGN